MAQEIWFTGADSQLRNQHLLTFVTNTGWAAVFTEYRLWSFKIPYCRKLGQILHSGVKSGKTVYNEYKI